jgi:hypothetical protein
MTWSVEDRTFCSADGEGSWFEELVRDLLCNVDVCRMQEKWGSQCCADGFDSLVVVPMTVCRDDGGDLVTVHRRQDRGGIVCSVDDGGLSGPRVGDDEDVVVKGADNDALDGEASAAVDERTSHDVYCSRLLRIVSI